MEGNTTDKVTIKLAIVQGTTLLRKKRQVLLLYLEIGNLMQFNELCNTCISNGVYTKNKHISPKRLAIQDALGGPDCANSTGEGKSFKAKFRRKNEKVQCYNLGRYGCVNLIFKHLWTKVCVWSYQYYLGHPISTMVYPILKHLPRLINDQYLLLHC